MVEAKRKKLNKGEVTKIILGLLAVSGVMAVAALAPNAVQMLAPLVRPRGSRDRFYIKTAANRLVGRGLLEFKKGKQGKTYLAITQKGRRELIRYQLREQVIRKPRHWDGKWRVIIFDIKELRRGNRDQLRAELVNFGFIRLQNSVWVYPYDCEELIALLKSSFELGKNLLYMTVEKLENDRWIRQHFQLH